MNDELASPLQDLNDCGCCEGLTVQTPVEVYNRPGLNAIAYRVGIHSQFKQSLLTRLSDSNFPALQGLNTREDNDFTIALLDAWATVADVLTFYHERIANESYLRTATERVSLLYLARLIGYELRPGVAASTYLAFTLEDAPGAPGEAMIDIGTKVQSIPGSGEQPQTFETVEKIQARAKWNAIKPQLTKPQILSPEISSILLQGIATNLKQGASLLIIDGLNKKVRRVVSIETNNAAQQTKVNFEKLDESISGTPSLRFRSSVRTSSLRNYANFISPSLLPQADLEALAIVQDKTIPQVAAILAEEFVQQPSTQTGVFAFRVRASLFGYNAPKWKSLLTSQRLGEWIIQRNADGSFDKWEFVEPAYPNNWDNPKRTLANENPGSSKNIDLDTTYPSITKVSWLALQSPSRQEIYQVERVEELSRSDFTISAKVTRLRLDSATNFGQFTLRETTVLAQSEQLTLAEIPILEPIEGSSIELDRRYDGLQVGQAIAIWGQRADSPEETVSEIATLSNIQFNRAKNRTILVLTKNLKYQYQRDTVTINANVALATHGETKEEVLGSGEASQPYQRFTLRQSPLTYVSAPTPSGAESTLQVRVNDVLWQEVPTLYGKEAGDRVFITRTDDEDQTTILFGDRNTGSRLPTGQENIKATFRKGIGLEGNVKAGQLSLLMTRPLGVKGVTNPLAATGSENPESREQARQNAPLTVLTLDRIVSLQDYEDFARAYAGIAKALATWTWNTQVRGVFVTVAGPEGNTVDEDSPLYNNLLSAMQKVSDPYISLRVKSYRQALFRLAGRVKINPDYLPEKVLVAVKEALRSHFSFERRQFGQGVTLSEVMALMQAVEGVIAVDIDKLYRFGDKAKLNPRLVAEAPRPGSDSTVAAAELLTLDPSSLSEVRVMS
jgi:predicted phage baseplate assembly protein